MWWLWQQQWRSEAFVEGWEDLLGDRAMTVIVVGGSRCGEACCLESGLRTIVSHHLGGSASVKQKLPELISYAESSFQKLFFFFLLISKNPLSKIAAS